MSEFYIVAGAVGVSLVSVFPFTNIDIRKWARWMILISFIFSAYSIYWSPGCPDSPEIWKKPAKITLTPVVTLMTIGLVQTALDLTDSEVFIQEAGAIGEMFRLAFLAPAGGLGLWLGRKLTGWLLC